ncbi:MBL fold metallo-hydrolase [Georgenia sp. Z1344]|uniref:MBL fold metallo-hydrolase n=1 Tax=Georgenia sp. Z1344 TaxID=3416706 RepID=UPI003CE82073
MSVQVERHEIVGTGPDGGAFPNNTYLVGDEREVLVVDPAHDADAVRACVGDRRVVGLVLTHGHWDHVGPAPELAREWGVEPLLHLADRFLWEGSHPDVATGDLADHLVLDVAGSQVTVAHTPGHTPGACSFLVPDAATVLTGDTLFPGGPGATRWDYSDFDQIITSIRKRLLTLDLAWTVAPGHGEPTTVGAEAPALDSWEARGW